MIHYVFKVLPKQGGLGGSHYCEKNSFSPFFRLEDEFLECEDHVARGNHLSVTTIGTRYQPYLDFLDGTTDLEEHLFARHLGDPYHQGQTEVEGLRMPDDYRVTTRGHGGLELPYMMGGSKVSHINSLSSRPRYSSNVLLMMLSRPTVHSSVFMNLSNISSMMILVF